MKWGTERKLINIGFVITLILLCILSFITFRLFTSNIQNDNRVLHTQRVIETSKEVLSNLKDAETGQRGYIITADESFLEPYYMSLERNTHLLERLKQLTADNPAQQKRIAAASTLVDEKLRYSKETIRIRREQGLENAVAMIKTAEGKAIMDKLRNIFRQIENEEQQLLTTREITAQKSQWVTERLLIAGMLVSIAILLLTYFVLHRQIRIRAKREKELEESHEWFSKTLSSIGEAVVATDSHFKISFMNPMAEQLTGWKEEEALGKPISFIYHAVNASTREKEEAPIISAISKKHIVTPTALPILIRKDGTERYIDTCGAPVLNNDEEAMGSVLIFRDVTEQKAYADRLKSENVALEESVLEKTNELIKNEHRLKLTLDNMLEGAQILSFDWKYLYVNNTVVVQSKRSKNELLGSTLLEQYPGIENSKMFKKLEYYMVHREASVFEHEFEYPDNTTCWFKLIVQPVPEGLFILSIDISERKKAEKHKNEYTEALEDMLHLTSHKVRQPVSKIMGISHMLDEPIETQEDLKKVTDYMREAVLSLDAVTKDFTNFIYELKQKHSN